MYSKVIPSTAGPSSTMSSDPCIKQAGGLVKNQSPKRKKEKNQSPVGPLSLLSTPGSNPTPTPLTK